jgi:outer membrane protein assembly factor BamB
MRRCASLLFLFATTLLSTSAADWPCWRGPDGLGVSHETGLPTTWGHEESIAWKVAVPGSGASSPIVVGERVYVTTQTEDQGLHLLAIERGSGHLVWDREVGRGKLHANNLHNMATPTPVADAEHVWAMFGTGDLACLDPSGKVLWHRNLVKEYGEYKNNHGYGSSPMLDGGRLFIVCMHQGPSYVLAIDARTGTNIWKIDRNQGLDDEAQDSYSSPIFLRKDGHTQLVIEGAEIVTSYDPATGAQLWSYGGLKVPHHAGRTISGPTASDDMIIAVASGFQNRGYVVALSTDPKRESNRKLWTQTKFSSDCPTPVICEDNLFMIRDDGNASCLNLKTGEPHWQERLFSDNVKVSPVVGDGKVYFMSGQGNCTVVKAAPTFEPLATNRLNQATLSTPAISHGALFVRTAGNLYCVTAPSTP